MRARTIDIEANPVTGRLVSNSGYGATIEVSGSNFGNAPPVILYQDWGDRIANAAASKTPITGNIPESDGTERCVSSWGIKGLGSRTGNGANPRTSQSFIFNSPVKNFYAATDMSIPSGWTFSGAAAQNETPTPLTSALKILWLFDGPGDPVDRADLVIGNWGGASFQMVGNQSGTSFSGSSSMDFSGWNYFLELAKDDYIELYWSSPDATVSLQHYAAGTSPTRPSTASLITTMNYISPNASENIYVSAQQIGQATVSHWANSTANKTYGYIVVG